MLNKKICMVGNAESGYETIKHLLENGIIISYFITITEKQAEKALVSGFKDFKPLAEKYNIPIYYLNVYSMKNAMDVEFFRKQKFDLLLQGGWQRLIPEVILKTFSIGGIGIHGSSDFLPKGRGRSPLNWSIIKDKKRFIMHLFIMKIGADNGDVFDYDQFDINQFDDIRTLYYKNSIVTKRMLLRSIPKLLDGTIKFWPQTGKESYFPKRTSEDGYVDWNSLDVYEIYNLIRAITKPYPGAFTKLNDRKIMLWKAQIFDTNIKYREAKYGEVVEEFENDLIVNCLGGLLLIIDYNGDIEIKVADIFE